MSVINGLEWCCLFNTQLSLVDNSLPFLEFLINECIELLIIAWGQLHAKCEKLALHIGHFQYVRYVTGQLLNDGIGHLGLRSEAEPRTCLVVRQVGSLRQGRNARY